MSIWIKHPRSRKADTMLTFSAWAVLACLGKFITNGVELTLFGNTINFGTIDAALITAVLTPTLLAYVGRKFTDSPDKGVSE